jgi:exosome complex exonuclease RRP6
MGEKSSAPDDEVIDEPSPPKRAKTDTIIQVKKKHSKSSSKLKPSSDRRPPSPTNGHTDSLSKSTVSTSSKPKEKNNPKKRTADVPDFDYSTAPNLLDNPRSGVKDQGKKKKKEKKERKGMFLTIIPSCPRRARLISLELKGADFGPAPKEKSNMRAGNKSGTF